MLQCLLYPYNNGYSTDVGILAIWTYELQAKKKKSFELTKTKTLWMNLDIKAKWLNVNKNLNLFETYTAHVRKTSTT